MLISRVETNTKDISVLARAQDSQTPRSESRHGEFRDLAFSKMKEAREEDRKRERSTEHTDVGNEGNVDLLLSEVESAPTNPATPATDITTLTAIVPSAPVPSEPIASGSSTSEPVPTVPVASQTVPPQPVSLDPLASEPVPSAERQETPNAIAGPATQPGLPADEESRAAAPISPQLSGTEQGFSEDEDHLYSNMVESKSITFGSHPQLRSRKIANPTINASSITGSVAARLSKPMDLKKDAGPVIDQAGQVGQANEGAAGLSAGVEAQVPTTVLEVAPNPSTTVPSSEITATNLETADVASPPKQFSVTFDSPDMGSVQVQVSNQGGIRATIVTQSELAFQTITAALPVDLRTTIESGIPTSEFSLDNSESPFDHSRSHQETNEDSFDQRSQRAEKETGVQHKLASVLETTTPLSALPGSSIGKLNVLV